MPSLKEYFLNDFNDMGITSAVAVKLNKQIINTGEIVHYDIEATMKLQQDKFTSCRVFAFYIPISNEASNVCKILIANLDNYQNQTIGISMIPACKGDMVVGNHSIIYSRRIFIYTETKLSENELKEIEQISKEKDLHITFRSSDYLKARSESQPPFAFISHDSRDKEAIAKPLSEKLNSRLCFTWYDEYSLKVGSSLRESIEKGIKETKKCILVLTSNYLDNIGWCRKEFDSIFTRELVKNEKVVLPIWYGITKEQVYEYSPSLADTVALIWPSMEAKSHEQYDLEIDKLINNLQRAIIA